MTDVSIGSSDVTAIQNTSYSEYLSHKNAFVYSFFRKDIVIASSFRNLHCPRHGEHPLQ